MRRVRSARAVGIAGVFAVVILVGVLPGVPGGASQGGIRATHLKPSRVRVLASNVIHVRRLARSQPPLPAPAPASPRAIPPPGAPPRPGPLSDGEQTVGAPAPASAPAATRAKGKRAPSQPPASSYAGLDDIANVTTGFINIPPDTDGAVGQTKVMESLNNNYRFRSKATGVTSTTLSAETFWTGLGATGFFDPRTTYDPFNDRWITVMLSDRRTAASSVEVGVSRTSDPEGAWWTWRIDGDAADVNWVDFPTVGFNKNWVAVNLNMFANSNDAYAGSKVLVIDYPTLRTGSLTSSWFAGTDATTSPAVTLSATENTLYMPVHWGHYGGTGNGAYRVWTITGTPSSPSVSAPACCKNRGIAWGNPIATPQAAPLAGASICGATPCTIDAGDERISSSPIVRGGYLYYAQGVGLPYGGITHDGVVWTKLDASGGASTGDVVDGGIIEDPTATSSNGGKWYTYPSVAVNVDNDIMVAYSQLSSSQYGSAGYSIHLSTDAAGVMRDPVIYKAGEDYYHKTFSGTRNRWGDYSDAQVDPANDTEMWTLQEYAKTRVGTDDGTTGSNSSRWGTYWARVNPHLPAITWDPSNASSRVASRPRTCNTPVGTCVDSGFAFMNGPPALGVSNNGTTHYVHAVWTTDAPTGDEGNGAVDHTTGCTTALNPATGSAPYCSGVHYSRSSDAGATWGGGVAGTAPFAVSSLSTHAGRAAIATSGSYVYVAYVTTVGYADKMCTNDARVLYVRVNNNYGASASWSAPVLLTSLTGHVDRPSIFASGTRVYVVHTDSDSGAIILNRSIDNGTSFTPQAIGNTTATLDNGVSPGLPTCSGAPTPTGLEGFAGRATVAGDGTIVGASWIGSNAGKAVAKISTDDGVTWPGGGGGGACNGIGVGLCSMHMTSSGALGAGGRSLVSASAASGRVAFAWVDDSGTTGPRGLYVRVFMNPGGWAPKRLVSCMQVTGVCSVAPAAAVYNDGYSPSIAMYGTTGLGVAWSGCPYTPTAPVTPCDQTSSGPNQDPGAEILWKESWNNGATWSAGEGPGSSYRLLASNAAAGSTIDERVSVGFDMTTGSSGGCTQQTYSLPAGIPVLGCNRYVLYTGKGYGGSPSRLYLSIGTQVPG